MAYNRKQGLRRATDAGTCISERVLGILGIECRIVEVFGRHIQEGEFFEDLALIVPGFDSAEKGVPQIKAEPFSLGIEFGLTARCFPGERDDTRAMVVQHFNFCRLFDACRSIFF